MEFICSVFSSVQSDEDWHFVGLTLAADPSSSHVPTPLGKSDRMPIIVLISLPIVAPVAIQGDESGQITPATFRRRFGVLLARGMAGAQMSPEEVERPIRKSLDRSKARLARVRWGARSRI